MTMVSASGWRVERVVRTVPGLGPSMRLRVSWKGYWQADCETSEEVAQYVDLSTLVPAVPHLYERAYPVTPWKRASDLLEAEMGRAIASADAARAPVTAAAGSGTAARLYAVPDVLPAPSD
jgi:hypothetical protein